MHATTEQLLILRDQQFQDVHIKSHVDTCPSCQKKLQDLVSAREQINDLASISLKKQLPFEASWEKIDHRVQQRNNIETPQRSYQQRRWIGGLSFAASVLVLVFLTTTNFLDVPNESNNQLIVNAPTAKPETALTKESNNDNKIERALLQRNAYLEQALRALPEPRQVVRGGTAATIASLEDQIALVDYGLSYADQAGISEDGSINLLQNRAELMTSLYQVRYSQAVASLSY